MKQAQVLSPSHIIRVTLYDVEASNYDLSHGIAGIDVDFHVFDTSSDYEVVSIWGPNFGLGKKRILAILLIIRRNLRRIQIRFSRDLCRLATITRSNFTYRRNRARRMTALKFSFVSGRMAMFRHGRMYRRQSLRRGRHSFGLI